MNRICLNYIAVFGDWLGVTCAWVVFFYWRKRIELSDATAAIDTIDERLFFGLLILPLAWIGLFYITGYYQPLHKLKAWKAVISSVVHVLIGSIILLLLLIPDDLTLQYRSYVDSFINLFFIHLGILVLTRLFYISIFQLLMNNGVISFPFYIIGEKLSAEDSIKSVRYLKKPVVLDLGDSETINEKAKSRDSSYMLLNVSSRSTLKKLLPSLVSALSDDHVLLMKPNDYLKFGNDFQMNPDSVEGKIQIVTNPIAPSYLHIKRLSDIIISVLSLYLLIPVLIFIVCRIKLGSPGPIFYSQERIGKHGIAFKIVKFRSMYMDSESAGPELSNSEDPRVTEWGRIMRRWKLDEIPQFVNVIKGDMALVGPRPERQFFIDQIMEKEPYFPLLLSLRPGITSIGQVKFGYASNIEEITRRLRFDLLYVKNVSFLFDLRILLETVKVLIFKKKEWH